jgi:hypothetical protein
VIPVEKLREIKQVVYHQSCPDGTAAAMICLTALRLLHGSSWTDETVDFKSVQYKTDFFENKFEPRPGQLFVDITPPRAKWEQWKDVQPIVLDHHDSVREITVGLGGVFGENSELMSGARLAYEHVLRPVAEFLCRDLDPERDSHNIIRSDCNQALERWDEFSRLAAIRDTWQDKDPDFERASVQAYGLMTLGSRDLLQQLRERKLDFGLITRIGEQQLGRAKFAAKHARRYEIPFPRLGRPAVLYIFNCTEKALISDGCHILLNQDADVAASYFLTHQENGTKCVVSLRTKEPVAGVVAKSLGGGGHDRASGFGLDAGESLSMDVIASVLSAQFGQLLVEEVHAL